MPKETCSKCGKDMTMPNGTSVIGADISVYPNKDPIVEKFVNEQLGKYAGQYWHKFCYECWLDTFYGLNKS